MSPLQVAMVNGSMEKTTIIASGESRILSIELRGDLIHFSDFIEPGDPIIDAEDWTDVEVCGVSWHTAQYTREEAEFLRDALTAALGR